MEEKIRQVRLLPFGGSDVLIEVQEWPEDGQFQLVTRLAEQFSPDTLARLTEWLRGRLGPAGAEAKPVQPAGSPCPPEVGQLQ
jgi:hypothetical protein